MAKNNRALALIIAIVFIMTMLFSAAYIAAEANHECEGEHCEVCSRISVCANTMRILSTAVFEIVATVALTYTLAIFCPKLLEGEQVDTLITLNVKLTN